MNKEIEFGRLKHYGVQKLNKPKRGKLVLIEGSRETVLYEDKPFAWLNFMKSELIKQGYKSETLKVKYYAKSISTKSTC